MEDNLCKGLQFFSLEVGIFYNYCVSGFKKKYDSKGPMVVTDYNQNSTISQMRTYRYIIYKAVAKILLFNFVVFNKQA